MYIIYYFFICSRFDVGALQVCCISFLVESIWLGGGHIFHALLWKLLPISIYVLRVALCLRLEGQLVQIFPNRSK